jgi:phosphatidylinositol alpha-1,6-mannosyltransferase
VLDLPGDVEGFGMVAIEAAAHGLATVGFRVGGVPDAIIEGSTGNLVEKGDYADFAARVGSLLERDGQEQSQRQCAAAAAAKFGWDRFGEHLKTSIAAMLRNTE